MEMHQLRYAVAVGRARNFSRAAEQCNVSQPALSQQIQKLEEELGEQLFDRMKRETKPTPAGEAFLRRAIRILEEADAAKREASDARELLRGVLTIGVLPTIAPYLLPARMGSFAAQYPGVSMVVHEDTTSRVLKMALSFEIDLALVSNPISDPRLEVRDLFSEELVVALPPKHALAGKTKLSAADLDNQPLILMKEGHCLGDQVLRFCDRVDSRPCISFRSAQLETIQALIQAGLGISLIPAMAMQRDRKLMPVYRSMQPPQPTRKILAVWPKQRPLGRAAAEFLKLLKQ
jgi:LysR family transcriptional regulator, hydrogen peroxide-inducible genes activator